MRRAIVIVMDGCGAGEAPDAAEFGDLDHPSTIKHVWEAVGGFEAPNLEACGFLAACGAEGIGHRASGGTFRVPGTGFREQGAREQGSREQGSQGTRERIKARYGRLRELSKGGKDSVTGHWEMAGIVLDHPFPTYPRGFPADVIDAFEKAIGRPILGNKPASGTEIIAELGAEHMKTGRPIVYTSADSVFQIACHEEVIPVPELYDICTKAREILVAPNDVERVIARPFIGEPGKGFTRTQSRKDFPLSPPPNLCDQVGDVFGIGVVPELFCGRGFRQVTRTQNNEAHFGMLKQALESDARFIWANFEDFDMLYGHRNDPKGFAGALERFDQILGDILGRLGPEDLLLLSADHGNDPTSVSTDHSREFVPAVVIGQGVEPEALGDVDGMTAIGATVAAHIGVEWAVGRDLLR